MTASKAQDLGGATSGRRGPHPAVLVGLIALGLAATIIVGSWLSLRGARVERLRREATASLASRQVDDAEAQAKRWREARPDDPALAIFDARLALANDRPQESVDALARAEKLGAPKSSIDLLKAVLLARAGRVSEAEPMLRAGLSTDDSPQPEAAEALTRLFVSSYRFPEARRALERWTRDAPIDAMPRLWKAKIDAATDVKAEEVAVAFQAALDLQPDLAEALLGLADALQKAQKYEESSKAYEAYLAKKPDDGQALLGAGQVAENLGQLDRAVELVDRALAVSPDDVDTLAQRASLALRSGQVEKALEWLDRALARDPGNTAVRYQRSLALQKLGRTAEAEQERKATELARRDQEELEKIRDGLLANPTDVTRMIAAARWLIGHGHADEGVKWARRAVEVQPGQPEACALLVDYFEKQGKTGEANFYRIQARKSGAGAR